MVGGSRSEGTDPDSPAGHSLYRTAVDVVLTGFAVIVPLVVTVYVLDAAFDIVVGALDPVVKLLAWAGVIDGIQEIGLVRFLVDLGIYGNVYQFLTELIAFLLLAVAIVTVGVVARNRYGERLIDYFDRFIASIPGIGAVYHSFRRMGDVMVESDVSNFQEVKLVEFPRDGAYVIGFVTNDAPDSVTSAAGIDEMTTLFLPLAPNPIMGGFLAHIPNDRVIDVDLTVEEGIRSIITTGIADDGVVARSDGFESFGDIQGIRDVDFEDVLENVRPEESDGGEGGERTGKQ